jgi:hypothetical protein
MGRAKAKPINKQNRAIGFIVFMRGHYFKISKNVGMLEAA